MAKKINRKDSKNRVLRQGEYARADGGYEYRWTDKNGQRHLSTEIHLNNFILLDWGKEQNN